MASMNGKTYAPCGRVNVPLSSTGQGLQKDAHCRPRCSAFLRMWSGFLNQLLEFPWSKQGSTWPIGSGPFNRGVNAMACISLRNRCRQGGGFNIAMFASRRSRRNEPHRSPACPPAGNFRLAGHPTTLAAMPCPELVRSTHLTDLRTCDLRSAQTLAR